MGKKYYKRYSKELKRWVKQPVAAGLAARLHMVVMRANIVASLAAMRKVGEAMRVIRVRGDLRAVGQAGASAGFRLRCNLLAAERTK